MGVIDNFLSGSKENVSNLSIKSPRDVFQDILKMSSGTAYTRTKKFDIFYQIIAFQGVKDGVGCSTLVANTALALARLGLNVCVIDTSIKSPSQDILLHTDFRRVEKKDRVDWMDMYRTNKNVLNTSKLDSKIGVLSFQDRTIIDLLSSNDNADMVELALTQLHTKFDLILIDVCNEDSAIATACLQEAHKIIQVWSDSPHILDNVKSFVANNTILSVPMDKMRNIVTSMTVDDIPVDWNVIMKQFGFRHLAHVGMSLDIARVINTGKMPFNYASTSEDIQEFNDCIADIVCNLLNITVDENTHKGTITSDDIMEGKVDGTLSKKLKEQNETLPDIATTLEEADMSLMGIKKVEKREVNYERDDNSSAISVVDEYSKHMNVENEEDDPLVSKRSDNGLTSYSDVIRDEADNSKSEESNSETDNSDESNSDENLDNKTNGVESDDNSDDSKKEKKGLFRRKKKGDKK